MGSPGMPFMDWRHDEEIYPPPPPIRIGKHPTQLEVAQRNQEIEEWRRRQEITRRRGLWGLVLIPLAVAGDIYLLMSTGSLLLGAMAFTLLVIAPVAWRVSFRYWRDGDGTICPEPLAIRPFVNQENSYLVETQAPEPFRAVCACPGCGEVDAHRILPPGPEWAEVVRRCGVCHREWAQG